MRASIWVDEPFRFEGIWFWIPDRVMKNRPNKRLRAKREKKKKEDRTMRLSGPLHLRYRLANSETELYAENTNPWG